MNSLLWLVPLVAVLCVVRVRRELHKLRQDGILTPLTGPASRGPLSRFLHRRRLRGFVR